MMERENLIGKLMEMAYDYDEYYFKQWLYNNVFVKNYKTDGEDVSYEYEVL